MKIWKSIAFLLTVGLIFFSACQKEDGIDSERLADSTNIKVYSLMNQWYLWNQELPDIYPGMYDTPQELIDAIKFKPLDRWSYVQEEETFNQFFVEGKTIGYGIGFRLFDQSDLKITYVSEGSPAQQAGLMRGFTVLKINGKPIENLIADATIVEELGPDVEGTTATFTYLDFAGQEHEVQISKDLFDVDAVLTQKVFEFQAKKIGYLAYNNFLSTSILELNQILSEFLDQDISELILDLRYNGGGSLSVARFLASAIGWNKAGASEFVELAYNEARNSENSILNFEDNNFTMNLERLVVITGPGTASASEVIINSLRSYLPVTTIGQTTSGKPVGMNIWRIDGYAVAPVTFRVENADGEADYFDGIVPDLTGTDDIVHPIGDPDERLLKLALDYIENGLGARIDQAPKDAGPQLQVSGFQSIKGVF